MTNLNLRTKSDRGFSLVEIIIATAVSSIVGIMLITIFVQNNQVFNVEQIKTSQGISLNNAVSEMKSSIRSASSIAASYPSPSPQYTSSADQLVLKLPSIDVNGNIITNTFDHLVITQDSLNNKILRKILFPDVLSSQPAYNKVLMTDLFLLNFSYLDASNNATTPINAAIIDFTLNSSTKYQFQDQLSSASASVRLRNDGQ